MNGSSSAYLHFATGDYLYLKTWQPTSAGAIAGACIGLVVLALFERWLTATRATLDLHWHKRSYNVALLDLINLQTVFLSALALVASSSQYASSADNLESNFLDKSPGAGSDF